MLIFGVLFVDMVEVVSEVVTTDKISSVLGTSKTASSRVTVGKRTAAGKFSRRMVVVTLSWPFPATTAEAMEVAIRATTKVLIGGVTRRIRELDNLVVL